MDSAELRNELVTLHRESYGWALACCSRDATEAENVLQTVYLKVLAGKARFNGRSAFKTWLFAVIRNTAADFRRREWLRRLRLNNRSEDVTSAASRSGFEEAIYQTEIQSLLRRWLEALPRRQQEVLQLVFYHDLSLAEAAEVMRVSTGSARTHYERAKKQLRRQMAAQGIHDESGLARTGNQASLP
jgi:RNA polymerase sigma-70 factor (ECF subfamily)